MAEDDADALKHIEALMIYKILFIYIYVCVCVCACVCCAFDGLDNKLLSYNCRYFWLHIFISTITPNFMFC